MNARNLLLPILLLTLSIPSLAGALTVKGGKINTDLSVVSMLTQSATDTVDLNLKMSSSDKVRAGSTALLFSGVLTGFAGLGLAFPASFIMGVLANPVTFAIGMGMLAGGTLMSVIGGVKLKQLGPLVEERRFLDSLPENSFPGLTSY